MQPLFNPHMLLSEHFSLSEMLASEAADITIPRRHWPFCYTSSEQIARLLFTWMKDNVDLHRPILKMISPVIN